MERAPRTNDVRLGEDGELEFFDGTAWVPYPDVPEDDAAPNAVSRGDDPA
ncbi:hypothetical protein [Streptomyces profundus]|nr:hypothetical protein [Streptomyces sp. MA3_2.13]UED87383.1 hypothetical protein K4G22_26840 [Streptomyces sp. MA3_2.13]